MVSFCYQIIWLVKKQSQLPQGLGTIEHQCSYPPLSNPYLYFSFSFLQQNIFPTKSFFIFISEQ